MCVSTDESNRCNRKPIVTNNEHDYSTWNINDYDMDLSDYLIDTNSKESTHQEPILAKTELPQIQTPAVDETINFHAPAAIKKSKRYSCPVCSKLWVTPSKLRRHLNVHKIENQMKLQTSLSNLNEPSKPCSQEAIDNSLQCPICNNTVESQAKLMLHMSIHIKDELRAEMRMEQAFLAEVPIAEKIGKRYICTVCRYETSTPSKLQGHMKTHMRKSMTDDMPQYHCTSCPESFSNESMLKRHRKSHLRPKSTKRRKGPKNHACLHCEKRFETPSKLQRHQTVHRDVFPKNEGIDSPSILEISAVTNILGD